MKALISLTVVLLISACGKKQDSIAPTAKPKTEITKGTYCGDTLLFALGNVIKKDDFGGISILADGVYTRATPLCSYLVHQGTVVITEGN